LCIGKKQRDRDMEISKENKYTLSEDLIEILANYFTNAAQVDLFLDSVADRVSGPLMKYLEAAEDFLKKEETEDPYIPEELSVSKEEEAELRAFLQEQIEQQNIKIQQVRKIAAESATLPPIFGTIWKLEKYTENAWSVFPDLELVLLVDTPEASDKVVQAIPVSCWPEMALQEDLIYLKTMYHPLVVASPKLEQPVLISRLKECVGHLMDEELDMLQDGLDLRDLKAASPEEVKVTPDEWIQTYLSPANVFQEFMTILSTPLRYEALEVLQENDDEVSEYIPFQTIETLFGHEFEKLNLEMPTYALAASGHSDDDCEAVIPLHTKDPDAEFQLTLIKKQSYKIELAQGEKDLFEGAKLITPAGEELAVMQNGSAIFDQSENEEMMPILQLKDGRRIFFIV
jgi:hypothetical protein